jgi:hypothetical protein
MKAEAAPAVAAKPAASGSAANGGSWKVFKDDYLMGSGLKDWDKDDGDASDAD